MPTPFRLGAAVSIAALGASLATPIVAGASAATTPPLPTLPDVTAALESLGATGTQAATIVADLQALEATPSSTAAITLLQNLDTAIDGTTGVLNGTLDSIAGAVNSVLGLGSSSPTWPLELIIGGLAGTAESTTNAAAAAAISTLISALQTAGLESLIGNLPTGDPSGVLAELAALQTMLPGASVPSGSLTELAATLTTLAQTAGIPTGDATTLQTIAGELSSGSVTPAELQTIVSQLQGIASSAPVGQATVQQITTEIATQLANAGTTLGGLGLPQSTVTTALTELQSLPSLPSGAPTGTLPGIGSVLSAIAAQPGVPATAAAFLTSLADAVGTTSLSPAALSWLTGQLTALSGTLPAPTSSTVAGLASALEESGSTASSGSSGSGTSGSTGSGSGSSGTGSSGSGSGSSGSGSSGSGSGGSGSGGSGSTGSGPSGSGSTGSGSTGTGSTGATGTSGSTGGRASHLVLTSTTRHAHALTVRLSCPAGHSGACTATIRLSERGHASIIRTVHIAAGHRRVISFGLPADRRGSRRRQLQLVVRSGSYRVVKSIA